MKIYSIISLGLAVTPALAIPIVRQREGKSSIQNAEDIFKRDYQVAGKHKFCTKDKTQTNAGYLTLSSTVPSVVASGYGIISTEVPNSYTTTPVATNEEVSPYQSIPSASSYTTNIGSGTPSSGDSTTGGNTYNGRTPKKSTSGYKKSNGKTTGDNPTFNGTSISTTYDSQLRKSSRISKKFTYTNSKPKGTGKYSSSKSRKPTSTTISHPSQSTTDPTPSTIETSNDTTSNDTTTTAPTSYLTMPAGSSTGLAEGASVANVGAEGSFMTESAIMPYLLAAHNIARSLHEGTNSITWNTTIAQMAQTNTPTCDFEHTPGAQRLYMGENISYNTNASPEDQALRQWYANEVVNYDFSNPDDSVGDTGHMTAMVWKSVTSFGCAVRNCGKEGMGLFLKCNYAPTANVIGYYTEEVGVVSGASTKAELVSIVTDATGFAPAS
ncbi:hypothetical protein TWF694_011215 [Orbilia ellipsospora]|uniref:SCP domain-containing protein n=1 Tax=Orbilia ellipsospora TaxID=2528407 RepID=A0AAV9X8F1_9PEZI